MKKAKPVSNFREDLAELEGITQALEGETTDLDTALKSFERGNELVAKLKQQLEVAQIRVREMQLTGETDKTIDEALDKEK